MQCLKYVYINTKMFQLSVEAASLIFFFFLCAKLNTSVLIQHILFSSLPLLLWGDFFFLRCIKNTILAAVSSLRHIRQRLAAGKNLKGHVTGGIQRCKVLVKEGSLATVIPQQWGQMGGGGDHICVSGESVSPKARASSGVRPFLRVRLTATREVKKSKERISYIVDNSTLKNPRFFSMDSDCFKCALFVCGVYLGHRISTQVVHDLRFALDLLLSLGWALVPGPWVADLTMRSMISSAASSPQSWASSTGGVHACMLRPEQIRAECQMLLHCGCLFICVTLWGTSCHPHLLVQAVILSVSEAPVPRWPPCHHRWGWSSALLSCARALRRPQRGPGPEAARSPGCH